MKAMLQRGVRCGATWVAVGLTLGCASPTDKAQVVPPAPIPTGGLATVASWAIFANYLAPPKVSALGAQGSSQQVPSRELQAADVPAQPSSADGGGRERFELLLRDARLAEASREGNPYRSAAAERGVLARALLEDLMSRSLAASAPSDKELDEVSAELWQEIDRPRAVRTGYAYVPFAPLATGEPEFAYMKAVAEVVRGLTATTDFVPRVNSVPAGQLEVEFGQVPPATADGRIVVLPDQEPVPIPPMPYAASVAALQKVGDTTDVVATTAGLFVGVALEILPPIQAPPELRERLIRKAVGTRRIAPTVAELQKRAEQGHAVSVSPKQQTLTRLVWRTD